MSMFDFILVLMATLTTPLLIRWVQSRPIEGPFGIIDLIIPQQDPRDRLLHLYFLLAMPFLLGVLIGFVASNKIVVAAVGVGLGALMSVSVAFFRPETLAPPLRQNLRTAQQVYGLFVLGYASLSAIGAITSDLICVIWRKESFKEGLIVNLLAWALISVITQIVIRPLSIWITRIGVSSIESYTLPSKENELRKLVREIMMSELKLTGGMARSKEVAICSEEDTENQQ